MQCTIHPGNEAVDLCRSCGKPICSQCGDQSGATFECKRCRPAADESATAGAAPDRLQPVRKSPVLAGILSILPGLGQAYNGEYLKGLVFFASFALLASASELTRSLEVFVVLLWWWQIYEAYHRARELARGGARPRGLAGSRMVDWLLVSGGLLAFSWNLVADRVHVRLDLLLPGLVILAGLALILSYFRGGEGART